MGGWGRGIINITPSGKVLPCHAAESLPGLAFDNVRDKRLRDIWLELAAPSRNIAARQWMREPCRSCEFREQDWGGCRCQAFAFAGDADARRSGLPQILLSQRFRRRRRAGGRSRRARASSSAVRALQRDKRPLAPQTAPRVFCRWRTKPIGAALPHDKQASSGDAHMRSAGFSAAKLAAGIGLAALLAATLAFESARAAAPADQRARRQSARHIRATAGEDQAGQGAQAACDAPDGDAAGEDPARQDQGAGRLQGRGVGARHARHSHADPRRQGHHLRRHARHRQGLRHHRQGQRAHPQGGRSRASSSRTASPSPRARCYVITVDKSLPPRRHRGQARQSRR